VGAGGVSRVIRQGARGKGQGALWWVVFMGAMVVLRAHAWWVVGPPTDPWSSLTTQPPSCPHKVANCQTMDRFPHVNHPVHLEGKKGLRNPLADGGPVLVVFRAPTLAQSTHHCGIPEVLTISYWHILLPRLVLAFRGSATEKRELRAPVHHTTRNTRLTTTHSVRITHTHTHARTGSGTGTRTGTGAQAQAQAIG
jgi:hypothetical protein